MKKRVLVYFLAIAFTIVGTSSLIAQSQPTPATPAQPAADTTPTPSTVGTTAAPAPPTGETEKMAPIIVTGSAIPTTDTEGASPVVVVDSAAIQQRGYQTVEDVLRNLPANGSFSNPGQTSGNFAAGGAYASLYGLGPQATLVLVNGRRVSNYAAAANGQYPFVDLNNIPAQIVDRVEILTSGTALYGADAVAGVINIITKKTLDAPNGEVDLYVGNTDNHDAMEERYTLEGNLNSFDKNGYGIVEADYEHQNAMYAGDRQISASANQSNNGGIDLRSGRTFPGIFQGETSGNVFSILPNNTGPITSTINPPDGAIDNGADALQAYDYNPPTTIIPQTDRYGTYLNYTYKFYDGNITPNIDFDYRHNHTLFSQAAGGYSFFDGDTGPSTLSGATSPDAFAPAGTPAFVVPTTNPFNQTGEAIDILSYRFVDAGPRLEDADSDVFRVVPSIDFKLGDGWTLNVGFNYSYTFLDDRNLNFISASGFQRALDDPNPATAYNPFTSIGGNTQAAINRLYANSENRDTSSIIGEDFRLNGKLFDLPAGPVQMAFGGEYRIERYTQSYAEQDLTGDVLASSVQLDTAASQKSLSGYTEVDIPITSPSFNAPGFYSMDLQVTGRVDKYSQFGSTENPQISLRWETIPGLVLRGTYGKAFRAPSLNELAAGGNQAFETVFDPLATNPDLSAPEVLVNTPGNPKLKPETAEVFDAGLAYSPDFIKGLKLTLDYFKIRYSNQIQPENAQELIDNGSSAVVRGPPTAASPAGVIQSVTVTYENLSNSYVDGFNMGASYVMGDPYTNWGQLTFGYNGTFLLHYITDDGTGAVENVGLDSGGLGPYSRYKQDVSVAWDFYNFEFVVSNNFASSYNDSQAATFTNASGAQIERNVASYVTFDLQASYTFDKKEMDKWAPLPKGDGFDWRGIVDGTRITVGCNNVYDFQPPFTANPSDTLGYDPAYADPTGRFLYGEISKKF